MLDINNLSKPMEGALEMALISQGMPQSTSGKLFDMVYDPVAHELPLSDGWLSYESFAKLDGLGFVSTITFKGLQKRILIPFDSDAATYLERTFLRIH